MTLCIIQCIVQKVLFMQFKNHGGVIVDLGNVLIDHTHTTPQLVENGDYSTIPEVEGAFEALSTLNVAFGGNVTVVYNATNFTRELIIDWFKKHNFVERTGIPLSRVCRTLAGRDKTPHISQMSNTHYGTTLVIDDRSEVLLRFVGKARLFLFNPHAEEVEYYRFTGVMHHVTVVRTWKEILEKLGFVT